MQTFISFLSWLPPVWVTIIVGLIAIFVIWVLVKIIALIIDIIPFV